MIALLSGLRVEATALLAGIAAGAFWLTVRTHTRRERDRAVGVRKTEPCRRCGARN